MSRIKSQPRRVSHPKPRRSPRVVRRTSRFMNQSMKDYEHSLKILKQAGLSRAELTWSFNKIWRTVRDDESVVTKGSEDY